MNGKMQQLRFDYNPLPWEKTSDGRYITYITLGEAGLPLRYHYLQKDGKIGSRTEVVTEEGLFNSDSVKSIAGMPVLSNHPRGKKFNLNKERLRIGNVLTTAVREDKKLLGQAIIDDYQAIRVIDGLLARGLKPEASSCYDVLRLSARSDGILEQFRGIYDHVAAPLLPGQGRGGQDLSVRFDSSIDPLPELNQMEFRIDKNTAIAEPLRDTLYFFFQDRTDKKSDIRQNDSVDTPVESNQKRSEKVGRIIRIDEKDQRTLPADVSPEVEKLVYDMQAKIDQLEQERSDTIGKAINLEQQISTLEGDKAQLEGQLAGLQARLDESDKQGSKSGSEGQGSRMDADAIASECESRLKTWAEVLPTLQKVNPDYQPNYRLDSTEIKVECLKTTHPKLVENLNLDSADDRRYLDGLWAGLSFGNSNLTSSFRSDAEAKTQAQYDWLLNSQREDGNYGGGMSGDREWERKRQEESKRKNTMVF